MAKIYRKTKQCYNWLFKELVKVLEGVDQKEIQKSLEELPKTFSLEDLMTILSKSYILYEGFARHIEIKMKPFALELKEGKPIQLKEKLTRMKTEESEETIQLDEDNQESIEMDFGKDVELAATDEVSKEKPEITGFKLDGKDFDNFKNSLEKKFSNFENINTINFSVDYQVDLFADHITDDLHKTAESIKDEMLSRFPGVRLKINVRPNKRTRKI